MAASATSPPASSPVDGRTRHARRRDGFHGAGRNPWWGAPRTQRRDIFIGPSAKSAAASSPVDGRTTRGAGMASSAPPPKTSPHLRRLTGAPRAAQERFPRRWAEPLVGRTTRAAQGPTPMGPHSRKKRERTTRAAQGAARTIPTCSRAARTHHARSAGTSSSALPPKTSPLPLRRLTAGRALAGRRSICEAPGHEGFPATAKSRCARRSPIGGISLGLRLRENSGTAAILSDGGEPRPPRPGRAAGQPARRPDIFVHNYAFRASVRRVSLAPGGDFPHAAHPSRRGPLQRHFRRGAPNARFARTVRRRLRR